MFFMFLTRMSNFVTIGCYLLFDKVLLIKIGFWCCQWELGFDVANKNWVLIVANENWALMLPMRIGFRLRILNPIDKIVLPWTWIIGFSNIVKQKYSWFLNRIECVYLKVNRWYLNKIRCKKKKKSTLTLLISISFFYM